MGNQPCRQFCPSHLSVHRKLDPLRYSRAAAGAAVSWESVRTGIQSTVSLLSGCLRDGQNVAVVLKDIGVLLIDGLTFHMRFYYSFLEQLSGKEELSRAALKVSRRFCAAQAEPRPRGARMRPTRSCWPLGPCECRAAAGSPCLGLPASPAPQP